MTILTLENFLTIMIPMCIGTAGGFIGLFWRISNLCSRMAIQETKSDIYHPKEH